MSMKTSTRNHLFDLRFCFECFSIIISNNPLYLIAAKWFSVIIKVKSTITDFIMKSFRFSLKLSAWHKRHKDGKYLPNVYDFVYVLITYRIKMERLESMKEKQISQWKGMRGIDCTWRNCQQNWWVNRTRM